MANETTARALSRDHFRFHRMVKRTAVLKIGGAPTWAKTQIEGATAWAVELECGHVLGPFLGNDHPQRMYCSQCAHGRKLGYSRRVGRGNEPGA